MKKGPEYAFLTSAPVFTAGGGAFSANFAAHARTLGSARALSALGYDARAYSLHGASVELAELNQAKAVVFGDPVGALSFELLRSISTPVLVCDSSNAEFRNAAFGRGAVDAAHIPAPYDGPDEPPRAPRVRRRSRPLEWLAARAGLATEAWRIRLVWSGEEGDLDALADAMASLQRLGRKTPLELRCLTPRAEALADRLREDDPDALRLAVETWTPVAIANARAACDFVLFPASLVPCLHAGRLGLARDGEENLRQFAWIGEDPAEGIRWALSQPREALERLRRGQQYVNEIHAPSAVARAWISLFMKGR